MQLKDLECFLTLPGAYPLTKLSFTYHDLQNRYARFVSNHNDGRVVHVAKPETLEGKEIEPVVEIFPTTVKDMKRKLKKTKIDIEEIEKKQRNINSDIEQEIDPNVSHG